jgi:chemotaxis protein CheX
MKVDFISPFINSVHNLFRMMFTGQAYPGKLLLSKDMSTPFDITALIGLSGAKRGTVALSLPAQTALNMVNHMLGIDAKELDKTISDGVGELVNMVAGSAKTDVFLGEGEPLTLTIPTVVRGRNFIVVFPSNAVWLEVPFNSDMGPFSLRVIFE